MNKRKESWTTVAFIWASQLAKQSRNSDFGPNGRPAVLPDRKPTIDGKVVSPDYKGGTLWPSPSFNPWVRTVLTRDGAFFKREPLSKKEACCTGGDADKLPFEMHKSGIPALDGQSGQLKTEYTLLTQRAGAVSTVGNFVFSGPGEGASYARDATRGTMFWTVQLGSESTSQRVPYAAGGPPPGAIATDRVVYGFALPEIAEGKGVQ